MAIFSDNYEKVISSLQNSHELSDIVFVHSFEEKKITRPVRYPICAVGIKNTYTYTDVFSYETFLIKVYSPLSEHGSKCHEYLNRIGEYLLKNINGVVSITSGSIDYNVNAMAFTSELTVKCRSEDIKYGSDSEDETVISVEIDGKIFDARYITAYINNSFHAVREMWNSNPIGFVPSDELIVIEIKFCDKQAFDSLQGLSDFSVQFGTTLYTGCYFTDSEFDHTKDKVNKAQIYAKRKQVVYG